MENAVVIDSCVFIEYWRSRNRADTLLTRLRQQPCRMCVSAVAKYEVLAGANDRDIGEWRRIFDKTIVLPFDDSTVTMARNVYRQLKRDNKLIDIIDILIAATAMSHNLPLATLNRTHFERVRGLDLAE